MKKYFLLIILLTLNFSCKKEPTSAGEEFFIQTYPLIPGTVWNYKVQYEIFNVRPESLAQYYQDTLTWYASVELVGRDTLRDSIPVWKFISKEWDDTLTYSPAFSYYSLHNDTMRLIAYSGGSLINPKVNSRNNNYDKRTFIDSLRKLFWQDFFINSLTPSDSLYFEVKPPIVLIFPLRHGLHWTFRERKYPFLIEKKVIGTKILSLPNTSPLSIMIQWFWDIDGNGNLDTDITGFDYITFDGIVKREFIFKDFVLKIDDPENFGFVDTRQSFTLISIKKQFHNNNIKRRSL